MKRNTLHIRLLTISLLMLCCMISRQVWGQNATSTLTLTTFPSTGVTSNYNNPIIGTATESMTFSLATIIPSIITTLGTTENNLYGTLYLRWYITDKSGNVMSATTTTGSTGSWIFEPINSVANYTLYNSQYYVMNINHTVPWIRTSDNVNRRQLMQIKVTKPSSAKWDDYQVVCILTNDLTGLTPNNITDYNTNYAGTLTKEPSNLKMKINFSAQAPTISTLGNLTSTAKKYSFSNYLSATAIAVDSLKFTVPKDTLTKALAVTEATWFPNLYARWYLVDNTTGATITDLTNWKFACTQAAFNSTKYAQGFVYYTKHAEDWVKSTTDTNVRSQTLEATIKRPTTSQWINTKVVCVVTNDTTGISSMGVKGSITKEPTNLKLQFEFMTYAIENLSFAHNYRPGGSIYTTDQVKEEYGQKYQKTSTWTYNLYVEPGTTTQMVLPLYGMRNNNGVVNTSAGSTTEPHGYYRWYDYKTDKASSIVAINNGTALTKTSWGHFCYNYPEGIVKSDVGVMKITLPSTSTGEIIACDISDYLDYVFTGNVFKEPTVNIRYLFNVRPAKEQAEAIKAITKPNLKSFYEHNADVTLNCRHDSTKFSLRVENRLPANYFFYPLTQSSTSDAGTWASTYVQGQSIVWFVVQNNNIIYAYTAGTANAKNARFFTFTKKLLNSINYNEPFEVFAYLSNETSTATTWNTATAAKAQWSSLANKVPIGYSKCSFKPNREAMTMDSLQMDINRKRTYEYLLTKYTLAAEINFDNQDEAKTIYDYSRPTNAANNMRTYPDNLNESYYGYIYPSLISKKSTKTGGGMSVPAHGEYGYYKSANVAGVSKNKDNGYRWYWNDISGNGSLEFFDRTYYNSSKTKYGYFMYTDASEESRPLVSIDINSQLCTGTNIVFIAWVADLTNAAEKPQIMFKIYGVDSNGKETILHSTMSEIVPGRGQWRQIFADITLQGNIENKGYDHYRVSIDNYCKNTDGADYAVDDIRVFIQTSKVNMYQKSIDCGDHTVLTRMEADYDRLVTLLGLAEGATKELRYRIVNSKGEVLKLNYNIGATALSEYGTTTINGTFSTTDLVNYRQSGDKRYFVFRDNFNITFDPNETYYFTIGYQTSSSSDWIWGKPNDICSIVSDGFVIQQQSVVLKDLSNSVVSSYEIGCTQTSTDLKTLTATLALPDGEGGKYFVTNVNFDWYLGGVMPTELITALSNLRSSTAYPVSSTGTSTITGTIAESYWTADKAKGSLTAANIAVLKQYTSKMSFNSRTLTGITLLKGINTFTAKVVVSEIVVNSQTITLCNDQLIKQDIEVKSVGSPNLYLGFSPVDYTAIGDGANAIRLGLKQLTDMQTNGALLTVPIKNYMNGADKTVAKTANLEIDSNNSYLNLIETNDPYFTSYASTMTSGVYAIAKINQLTATTTGTDYYIVFNFKESTLKSFTVHEGYWYKVRFSYKNGSAAGNTCSNSATFTIKVVPEYLTYTGTGDNWNNDANWTRSTQARLYKDISGQNTDSYANYPLTTGDGLVHQGYVPMKFTKVTIITDAEPALYALSTNASTNVLNMTNSMTGGQAASTNIEYDMMVKNAATSGYDCEKFYGNYCDQIYFKPSAEIQYQHLLTYDKAWVEFELTANRWYMLASPLHGVVAGDMYLPLANRRQETEAFQPITFDLTLAKHNRSQLPVYQRSWDKSSSMVLKPDGTKYDAYKATVASWSYVYNDVAVDYSSQGFSIKPDRQDAQGTKVLFRLPKADTSYRYYTYDDKTGNISATDNTTAITRNNSGKLRTYGTTGGNITIPLATNGHSTNDLYLMSNPYMATIDMNLFFAANPQFEAKYWLVTSSEQKTYIQGTLSYVVPMQSFFVKLKAGGTASATFTPAMMVKRSVASGTLTRGDNGIASLTITAQRNELRSTATIVIDAAADNDFIDSEDAEALFDSNLAEMPTIYTVAGLQTTSINVLPEIISTPLGLQSDDSGEVTICFDGVESIASPLYLYDAKTESHTELYSGMSITVSGTTAGRYYILGSEPINNTEQSLSIYSQEKIVFLSASSGLMIEQVMVYNTGGMLVFNEGNINEELFKFSLSNSGTYIIKIETNEGMILRKIVVK